MNSNITRLHTRALEAANLHKKSEADLISILQEIDYLRAYLHFEVSSLYDYCLKILNLSESTSYNLISVSRKAKQIPALQEASQSGELSISKARKILPVLNKSNQDQWITLAKTETSRKIEKAVAKENPQALIQESVRYRTEDRIELKIGISEELLKKIERLCDLESQRTKSAVTREQALLAAVDKYLENNDPLKKAERSLQRAQTSKISLPPRNLKPVPGQVRISSRPPLNAATIHFVTMRDYRQCTHKDSNGVRCKNTRWLEVHHVHPKSLGGSDHPSNLTTLCASHHRFCIAQTSSLL